MTVGSSIAVVMSLLILPPIATSQAPGRSLLLGGWTPDDVGLLSASGIGGTTEDTFDLRLLDAIGKRAGLGFSLRPMEKSRIDGEIGSGTADFALPAIKTPERESVARFSVPYATRSDLLFVGNNASRLTGQGRDLLLSALRQGLRVGIVRGEEYGDELDVILTDPNVARQVVIAASDAASLDLLMAGRIDAFLAPRLSGLAAIAAQPGAEGRIGAIKPPVAVLQLCVMFSRKTVDSATVAAFDRALSSLRADGTEARLLKRSIAPILLRLAAAASWFNWLDIIGTVAFAMSGVIIARREGYSIFGAFTLATLPAVGGGIVRDLLVGRSPIGILSSPLPLSLVVGTVLFACIVLQAHDATTGKGRLRSMDHAAAIRVAQAAALPLRNMLELTDAIGLAAFTVTGVVVAVRFGAEPLWLWGPLCASLSAAGGGILRDMLRADSNNPALHTSFYAEICLIWGLMLSLTVEWLGRVEQPQLFRTAVAVTVIGAFITRIAVVLLHVRSPRI
jgi:polar amino acid transport system substrate-binding protein